MYRLRLLSRKESNRKPSPNDLVFGGIRTEEKLKNFLLSDLMTYRTYMLLSDNYFSSKSGEDEQKHLREIIRISKTISLFYAGNPSGTPADQISKRVENLICLIRGETFRFTDAAVVIADSNIQFYHDFFSHDDSPQIAIQLVLPGSSCAESIRLKYAYEGGSLRYVAMSDLCTWIIQDILEKSRSDLSLQSIMKVQYDLLESIFGDKFAVPENIIYDLIRWYIAISCCLHNTFERIGDMYGPVFNFDSFKELIPTFKLPFRTDNLIIVLSSDEHFAFDPSDFDGLFKNIQIFSNPIDNWDLELMLYKARLSSGYRPYNLIAMDIEGSSGWMSMLIESMRHIKWLPIHMIIVSDNTENRDIQLDSARISYGSRSKQTVLFDILNTYGIGFCSNDRYAESILRTTFKDILELGYPNIGQTFDSVPLVTDSIRLFKSIKDYVNQHELVCSCDNLELVLFIKHYLNHSNVL